MKRLVIGLVVAGLLAVGTAGAVFAQTPAPGGAWQPGWGCWGGGYGAANGNYDPSTNPTVQRLASALNMSAQDLASELKGGKSVADVAKEKNVSLDSVVSTLLQPQKDMLALRVKYGYITQEQADAALKAMTDAATSQLQQQGYLGGGYGWGPGMMGSYGWGPGMMGRGGYGPGFMGRFR